MRERWDGRTENTLLPAGKPRQVLAGACFDSFTRGLEHEAALCWAFELDVYFKRGVGEQPVVRYEHGRYVVVGLITTTHPGDHPHTDGVLWFTTSPDGSRQNGSWSLDFCRRKARRRFLLKLDGREDEFERWDCVPEEAVA